MSARLRVEGDVRAPLSLDFAALEALPDQLVEPATLAGRGMVAVRLTTLLALAGVLPNARSLIVESADGFYTTSLPLEAVVECVVAYRIGDGAFPRGLGGPFRLLTKGRVRAGDVKAIGRITVSDRPVLDDEADTEPVRVRAAGSR